MLGNRSVLYKIWVVETEFNLLVEAYSFLMAAMSSVGGAKDEMVIVSERARASGPKRLAISGMVKVRTFHTSRLQYLIDNR